MTNLPPAAPPAPEPPSNPVGGLFEAPGTSWNPVSPKLQQMRRLLLVVWLVVVTLIATVGAGLLHPLLALLPLLGGAGLVALGWWLIGRNWRSWGYAERPEDLYVTGGVMFRRLVVVPYGRMQYVDVQQGPLQRLFGIATVQLHTASPATAAQIAGLPPDEAQRLRDRLTERGNAEAAGL